MKSHVHDRRLLTSLTNIGPTTGRKLLQIGITTADAFLARDPYEVFYELLVYVDRTMCRCALGLIVGAYEGKKWNLVHERAGIEFARRYPQMPLPRCYSGKR